MTRKPTRVQQTDADLQRLLRRYLANGVVVAFDATQARLSFSYRGMGTVVVEATTDGLVLHEPVQLPEVRDPELPKAPARKRRARA